MAFGSMAVSAQTAEQPQPQQQMQNRGDNDRGHGGHHDGQRGKGRHMMMLDANSDGVIGDDEAASLAERVFNRMDRDNNGEISEAEFTTVRQRGGWWRWFGVQDEAISDAMKVKFAAIDTDRNASVNKAEFLADAKTRYMAADADKDGKVTPWELRGQM
jgi:hypothetical protein